MTTATLPSRRRLDCLKAGVGFLDQQTLMEPSVNVQIGFDFQGLRKSYRNDPSHPDAPTLARYGRIWIYDAALGIYADLKAGRLRQAGYQAGRLIQVALCEKERGFKGLWHFSYNTQGDSFIDPRGPTGANAWCLNALYAFILATGNTAPLSFANQAVQEFLFPQQVMDPEDPRYGLIRAGLHNAEDCARGEEGMGYRVYEGSVNHPYEHVILEHNADVASTLRLAFRATKRFSPNSTAFLEELIHRHEELMRGVRRSFWQADHFVTALDGQGQLYRGTDGSPSIAVDNNTWSAHIFLPYDAQIVRSAIRYVEERFIIQTPWAKIEDCPNDSVPEDLEGVYYFPATFVDPFVQVAAQDRAKMELTLQPEAAFGFILFLKDAADLSADALERQRLQRRARRLYEDTVNLLSHYGPSRFPYASARVPAVFSTLDSVTTAATAAVVTAIMQGSPNHDFIGAAPPAEFVVDGVAPRMRA